MNKYLEILMDLIPNASKNEATGRIISSFLEDHGEELTSIITKYGKDAFSIIGEMFDDENAGSTKYYDAIQEKNESELLDEAFAHFEEARKLKSEFKEFVSDIGSVLGIIGKSVIKVVNPLG